MQIAPPPPATSERLSIAAMCDPASPHFDPPDFPHFRRQLGIAPPPPAPGARPVAIFDTECFHNYWLLKMRPRGGPCYSFRLYAGQRFSAEDVARIRLLFAAYTAVSFNGNGYDKWTIAAALSGFACEQLKWVNDRIIADRQKPWLLGLPKWSPDDHIDVMEVIPGDGGQKLFAGRIHHKTMRDLPYDHNKVLEGNEFDVVDEYCENDLDVLEALYVAVQPQIKVRILYGKRYGLDLRSKSDAQMAEAVLKHQCEVAQKRRIFKPQIDWAYTFRYRVPEFISFQTPELQYVLEQVKASIFRLKQPNPFAQRKGKAIAMPPQLEGLTVTLGETTYAMGIGGLHSKDERRAIVPGPDKVLRDADVRGYYPNQMLKSGEYPPTLGPSFVSEYGDLVHDRDRCKALVKALKKAGIAGTAELEAAEAGNDGGKIMSNGTFGKTGSPHSVLWAPTMMIQTTLNGQLSLLMLIEWHELYGIPIVSANTDGIVMLCPRDMLHISDALIHEWERRTGLEMEFTEYRGLYMRDVNNYVAIKTDGEVKRKGEYAPTSLIMKKSPDNEICSEAVADFLANGTPLLYTIAQCRDIRKFVTIQNVNIAPGAAKMWGEGPRKNARVRDMLPIIEAAGWVKAGRKWRRGDIVAAASEAYAASFAPQRCEPLGKVIRWYYSTQAPGPIVYLANGNLVGGSYGARPCMTLPDEFPTDIDYGWYLDKAAAMLAAVGYKG